MIILIVVIAIVQGSSSLNPLTKGQADTLYCAISDGCGSSSASSNIMYFGIQSSMYNSVVWNVSKATSHTYTFQVRDGRHFVFGDEI